MCTHQLGFRFPRPSTRRKIAQERTSASSRAPRNPPWPSADAALPFMVTKEAHRPPGSSAPPRKFALSSGHCAPMAAALRSGRLRSSLSLPPPLPARAPCSALCAAGPPRALLTPGGRRRARQRPSPWPAGARRPPRPRPSRALPRPPRPRAGARPCPVPFSPCLSPPSLSRVLSFALCTSGGTKSEESFSLRLRVPLGVRRCCCC